MLGGLALGGAAVAIGSAGGGSKGGNTKNPEPVPEPTPKPTNPKVLKTFKYDSSMFYAKDSDHDGLFDALDPNPHKWDVSERDLRAFSTLAYESESTLSTIFNGKNLAEWEKINQNTEKGFNQTFSQPEGRDFIHNWTLLEHTNTNDFIDSGLDYSVFGQGKREDGTYQELVFAFRGSKSQLIAIQDYFASTRAIFGNLPTQAKELAEQTTAILRKYNPDSIYATGHSLGGYLTQYFAGYVAQTPEFQDKFKHSAIFNPLKLINNVGSDSSIYKATEKTNEFIHQSWDYPDITHNNPFHTTNSYVINGEFLADGIPAVQKFLIAAGLTIFSAPLGLSAWGLMSAFTETGTYENTMRFTPDEKGWLDGHKLIRFYEKTDNPKSDNDKLTEHFSFGNRHDRWANGKNDYAKDSDGDGIPDVIERYGLDNLSYQDSRIYDKNSTIAQAELFKNGRPTGQTEMVGLYQFDSQEENYKSPLFTHTEHIYGNKLNNIIDGGHGNNVLFGGAGADIFVLGTNAYTKSERNIIGDFNTAEDKLDISALGLKNTDIHQLFSDNIHHKNASLIWNQTTQELHHKTENGSFLLAQFLNHTTLNAEHFIV